MPTFDIRLQPPADLPHAREALLAAHADVHGSTAEESAAYARVLDEHAARPGFRWASATPSGGGPMTGYAYGYTGAPGQPWRDLMAAAAGSPIAETWLDGHFEFAQLGVLAAHRRQGIAARLTDALFDGLPHRRAVLTVRMDNDEAFGFYLRRGWRVLHEAFEPPDGAGPYAILGLETGTA
ncbi:MAG: GNAT family N-acetyltransferase [Actinobacteria bacterium]|nr:GNAT family N-acetyltransferase [Actinomycetota bacterium]